jgi:hypothetical protein
MFGQTIQQTVRAIVSNSVFLGGNMDNDSNCEMGMIKFCDSKMMWGRVQTLQELFNLCNSGRVCQDERVDRKEYRQWSWTRVWWKAYKNSGMGL